MANFDQLIADVKAAFENAGFRNITTRASGPGTLVSAENGTAGAMLYVTPHAAGTAAPPKPASS